MARLIPPDFRRAVARREHGMRSGFVQAQE